MKITNIIKNRNIDKNINKYDLEEFNEFLEYVQYCIKNYKTEANRTLEYKNKILIVEAYIENNDIILRKYYINQDHRKTLYEIEEPEHKKDEKMFIYFEDEEEREIHFEYFTDQLLKKLGKQFSSYETLYVNHDYKDYAWFFKGKKNITEEIHSITSQLWGTGCF